MVDWVERTGSTNADVKARALAGAPHGSALAAEVQTEGRGRLGREWQSRPGNLHLSVLLRPRLRVASAGLVALAAGVAAVDACDAGLRLKWPNDLLAPDGRKVGGVLAELDAADGWIRWVVVGLGVDVAWAPPELPAACLAELGDPPALSDLAERVVAGLLAEVEGLVARPESVLDRWRARAHTLGRRVVVGGVAGEALDVDPSGALLVRDPGGRLHRVSAGDVEG